jgi:hypothetical protein
MPDILGSGTAGTETGCREGRWGEPDPKIRFTLSSTLGSNGLTADLGDAESAGDFVPKGSRSRLSPRLFAGFAGFA